MKTKKTDILICVLFCGFLFSMLLLLLVLPQRDFSEREKRYLSDAPELTAESLFSGEFGEDMEDYLADHVPGRDFFVGLNACYDKLTGRQVTKAVYTADGKRLVEAPVVWNGATAEKNMTSINRFAESIGQSVDLMIVPSAGFVLEDSVQGLHDPYTDDVMIADLYAMAGEDVSCVDLIPTFTQTENPETLYYGTDHHWTSLGAYTAYEAYMELLNREHPVQSDFTVERFDGFYGSNHSRSGLWYYPADEVELWKTETTFTVVNNDTDAVHDGLFYEERLQELDKYTVYLDGNHSLVRIENPDAAGTGSLLVIRDSYANCLGTFLAHAYESVILVDLRYYKQPVSELFAEETFTDVLVCYSIGNFLTDNNLIFLR